MWLKKISQIVFILGLCIPSIVAPVVLLPSTLPRAVFVLALGVSALFILLHKATTTFTFSKVEIFFFAYCAILVITAIFGVDPAQSFWSDGTRALGVAHIVFFALWLIVAFNEMKKSSLQGVFWWVLSVQALVISVLSIMRPFFFDCVDGLRLCGTFGNPMIFAGYLAPLLLILMAGWWESERLQMAQWFRAVVIPVTVVVVGYALYATTTRAAVLGLLVGVGVACCVRLFHFFHEKKNKQYKKYFYGGIIFIILIIGSVLLIPHARNKIFEAATLGRGTGTITTRLLNWQTAVQGAQEHLVLGRGSENYRAIADKYFNSALLDYSYYETRIDKPHNAFLELLVSTGFVGLITYLAFLVTLFLVFIRYAVKVFGIWPSAWLAGAFVTLQITLFFSFETYASLTILAYLLLLAHGASPSIVQIKKPSIFNFTAAQIVLMFAACVAFIYGGVLPLRAAYVTQWALNYNFDNDISRVIRNVNKVYTFSQGPYDFEIWQWTSGALLSNGALEPRSRDGVPSDVREELTAAVRANTVRTEKYLSEHYIDSRWQLFGGKAAYHAAILLDDLSYLQIAERAFKQAQGLVPGRQEAWDLMVYVHMLQGKYPEAVADALHAVRIRNTNEIKSTIEALVDRLQKEGRIDLIAQVFEELIRIQPTADLYARLAAVYAALHKYPEAREAVMAAVKLDPAYAREAGKFLKQLPK